MSVERVVYRYLYAKIKLAMSVERALEILGFSTDEKPTELDISKAYKKKVLEKHPDLGGSHEEMVELNVAKEVLDRKRPSKPDIVETAPSTPTYYRPEKPKEVVVTFEEAASRAGIPSGVDWVFVTARQRDRGSSYSGDESSASRTAFVAYGRTDKEHVFAAAYHDYYESFYVGGVGKRDVWDVIKMEYPIREGEKLEPSWLYGNIVKAFKKVGFDSKFNSKVQSAKGWKFSDKWVKSPEMSIKNFLVDIGETASDDPSVAGRKQVVEFQLSKAWEDKPGYWPIPDTYGGRPEYYQIVLFLNGRPTVLGETCVKKIVKARLYRAVYGDYVYDSNPKKNLTRMQKGKQIISWMVANLDDLPESVKDGLKAAAAQMKG